MGIDWITALGMNDKSIEGRLARGDMSKQIQLLESLAGAKEQKRQFGERQALDVRQLDENTALRQANQEATKAHREQTDKEQASNSRRQRFQTIFPSRAGERVGVSERPLLEEFGSAGDFTADPNDEKYLIYKQREAEDAAEKARLTAERAAQDQERQNKNADRVAKAQEASAALATKADKRAEDGAKRAQSKFDDQKKRAEAATEAVPVHLRPGIKQRYEQILQEGQGKWYVSGDDESINNARAWIQATEDIKAAAASAGQVPLGSGPPPAGAAQSRGREIAPGIFVREK